MFLTDIKAKRRSAVFNQLKLTCAECGLHFFWRGKPSSWPGLAWAELVFTQNLLHLGRVECREVSSDCHPVSLSKHYVRLNDYNCYLTCKCHISQTRNVRAGNINVTLPSQGRRNQIILNLILSCDVKIRGFVCLKIIVFT